MLTDVRNNPRDNDLVTIYQNNKKHDMHRRSKKKFKRIISKEL
jgi:hypothetical protein